jgi:aspartate 1-decarboxylase
MLKSKIHRATLTGKALDYEGSIALDLRLMEAADLLAGEQVHVLNVNTGSRLVTYVIVAPADSGTVMLNGPAARPPPRDTVMTCTFATPPSPPVTIRQAWPYGHGSTWVMSR